MSSQSLLALTSAANEAAIAYRDAADSNHLSARRFAGALLEAVDALTAAVVEAENERMVLDELLTPAQLAEYLSTTVGTLSQQRHLGVGPPYVRSGKLIRYRVKDVAAYLEAGQDDPPQLRDIRAERDRLADEVVGLREANRILLARQPGEQRRSARQKVAARHLVEDGDDEDQERFKQAHREWRATRR